MVDGLVNKRRASLNGTHAFTVYAIYYLTASFKLLPGLNAGTFDAGILI